MKLFFVVTLLHLPNVCSSQHELCRKQIASIFCMNFDKEEIRACRKTVTLRIEGDEVCDVSGRCATVLLPCMKLLPPDTTTTTTTEKAAPARVPAEIPEVAAPARVPAEIPEVREAADTTTTTTTEKAAPARVPAEIPEVREAADTTTTTTTEKAAPARVPAEIPEVREAADTTTTTTTEKAEEFGEALASSVKVIVNCVSKPKILSQT